MKQITLLFGLLIGLVGTVYGQYTGGRLQDTRFNVSIGFFGAGGVADYVGPVGVIGSTGYTVNDVQAGDILIDDVNLYRIDSVQVVTSESLATLHVTYLQGTVGSQQAPVSGKGAIIKPSSYLGLLLLTENGSNYITEEQEAKILTHNFLLIDSLLGNISIAGSPDLDTINYLGNGQYEVIDEGNRDTINTQADSNPIVNPITIEGNLYPAITTSVQTILENLADGINNVRDSVQMIDNGDGTYTSIIYGDSTTIYVKADSIPIVQPITINDSTYVAGTSVEDILNALVNNRPTYQEINSSCAFGVRQVAHGFTVGQLLSQAGNNGDYFVASTIGPDSLPVAYVCSVVSVDSFMLSSEGMVYGTHAYLPGRDYFVQDAQGVYDTIQDADYTVFAFRAYPGALYFDIPELIVDAGGVGGSPGGDITGFTYDGSTVTIQTTGGNYTVNVNTGTMETSDSITIAGIDYPDGTPVQTILEALAAPGADKNGIISELPIGNVDIINSSNNDLTITQSNGNQWRWDFGSANGPTFSTGNLVGGPATTLDGTQLYAADANGNSGTYNSTYMEINTQNGVINPGKGRYDASSIDLIQANGSGAGNRAPNIVLKQFGQSYPVFKFLNGEDTDLDQDLFDSNPLLTNRQMGRIEFWGQNVAGDATTSTRQVQAAAITAESRENFTGSANGSRLVFYTTPIGTNVMLSPMILEDNGRLRLSAYTTLSLGNPVRDFQMDNSGYVIPTPATVSGTVNASTDASGLITVTHSIGTTPLSAHMTIEGSANAYFTTVTAKTTTTVTFKVWDAATGNAVPSTAITAGWMVK